MISACSGRCNSENKENDKEQDCHNVNDAAEIEILEVEEEGGQESICTNDVCSPRSSSSTSTKLLDNNRQESDNNAWPNNIEEAVMEPNGISDIKKIDDKNNLPPPASSPLPASSKSEIDIKREMLKMMPTPKIPPFVKSDPPCDFQDDPTTWIEWLEEEVLKFKEEQIMKKKKAEQQKSLEEERNKLEEERNTRQARWSDDGPSSMSADDGLNLGNF